HNIVLWRGLAEIAEKYVKKGSKLYIEGKIRTRSYDDAAGNKRYVTEIWGDTMELLDRKPDNTGTASSFPPSPVNSTQVPEKKQVEPMPPLSSPEDENDDLPF
ncbi:MAG: single-stranded DNA-binding protein, partial [Candidatus Azobacteroides sp.]|nr:single-stranded DNA-binding protein [Candidatus Azobacteroides sp.]